MHFIMGKDPGREGGICVLDPNSEIFFTSTIPYKDSQVDHVEYAQILKEINLQCNQACDTGNARITCYIEKIYTRPEDAGSESYIKSLENVASSVSRALDNYAGATVNFDECMATTNELLKVARRYYATRDRRDGRVGVLNYAKSAGMLFMGAMLGWEIIEVHPRTWGELIKKGHPGLLDSKEKSKWAVTRFDESLLLKGSPLWHSSRARKVHMGILEAYLISKYGRIDQGLDILEGTDAP